MTFQITPELRSSLTLIVSQGLTKGLGDAVPGQMCLEAAICLALGEQHGDKPSCVAKPDNEYAIKLQDAYPGTNAERAALFLRLGLAQLGTAGANRQPWIKRLVEGTIRKVLPISLRCAAGKAKEPHCTALNDAADRCANEGTLDSVLNAKRVASVASVASVAASVADAAYAASVADAAYAAYVADAAVAAAVAASVAAYAVRKECIEASVAVALEAYKAEGRE